MATTKTVKWFKKQCAVSLPRYNLEFRFHEKCDFGSLHQVLFTAFYMEVEICFWELGWLGIVVRDFEKDYQILHILLQPGQEAEKDDAFEQLRDLLQAVEHQ